MEQQVRVGVAVFVFYIKDGTTFVLIGKRKGSHGAGKLQLPGGHLEMFESFEDCTLREVEEETGVKVNNISYFHCTNDPMPLEKKHYITIFMKCKITEEEALAVEVKEPHRNEFWNFVSLPDLLNKSREVSINNILYTENDMFIPLNHIIQYCIDQNIKSLE